MEHLQPYIDGVVGALVSLLVAFVIGVVAMLRVKVTAWLESRTNAQQREILHRLAQEGMAYAETAFKQSGGMEKLTEAFSYVFNRASNYGIKVGADTIRAAIEKAVLDYNAKVKGGGAG
ncbi:MAG: phage holin [Candidatus Cohnella colombiensis]|uniref:Phage holin n=1 Tax=Candidatus Cohnella colombiensis TaxID=3121368 RepID=A0AA95EU74_9BACL|nr:MAG: phage holin [Cohnella sp.]